MLPRMSDHRVIVMNEESGQEVEDKWIKVYRLEVINHIGYIISTIVVVFSLFNWDMFLKVVNIYQISLPIIIGVVFIFLVYFAERFFLSLIFCIKNFTSKIVHIVDSDCAIGRAIRAVRATAFFIFRELNAQPSFSKGCDEAYLRRPFPLLDELLPFLN